MSYGSIYQKNFFHCIYTECHWPLLFCVSCIASMGCLTLYSAAQGHMTPWALKHFIRYIACLPLVFIIAFIPIAFWLRHAYSIYIMALLLLILVTLMGHTTMGATRWISLGGIKLQPSEMMKLALILALSRYFHCMNPTDTNRNILLLIPLCMVFFPCMLIMKQPDLGTALILVFLGGGMFFVAGVSLWKFAAVIVTVLAAMPILWNHLHNYQKKRIFTFLNPEGDPLGAGYNLLQSKIAIGSGGFFGKGFLLGTQSQLSFLPEKQTDFIFTMLAEEWGLVGGICILLLYSCVLFYGFRISMKAQNHFGRMLGMGITILLFFHVFINIAMVMGLIPIVGVPLPLVSNGGTIMITVMLGVGLLQNIYLHREEYLSRFRS